MVAAAVRGWWPALVAAAVLVVHVRAFAFVGDDAYVSFVYARNLVRHGELVFNLGERVEGYTNFLWTMLLAGVHALGLDLERWSQILGAAASIATLFVVVRASRVVAPTAPTWTRAIAPLLLAACSAFACWTSGGLETALFTLLVTLAATLHLERREIAAGTVFAAAAMTRPEGALLMAVAAAHGLVTTRRAPVRLVVAFVALFGPYFAWRWRYYGWPFPNTYYVKGETAAAPATREQGVRYLEAFAADFGAWFLLPLFAPVRPLGRWALVAAFTIVFGAYVVNVGGDFMGLYRFLVPLLPLLALHAEHVLRALPGRARPIAASLFLAGLALQAPRITRAANLEKIPIGGLEPPGFLRRFALDRAVIGRWFGEHARRDDLAVVGGCGAQIWYGDTRAIDGFGLVDAYVAHHVPATRVDPGHQKWAPLEYLLSRKPDFLCQFDRIAAEPYVPPPEEAAQWREAGYHWVSIHLPELRDRRGKWYSFLKRRERAIGPLGPDAP